MSITTIGDHLIHYEALGRGDPLIFVHGWLGSWRYWWPSMQELSMRYRTFAFDLWGFGDSSKVKAKYSFASYVEMLDQFVDKLGIATPFVLVGHGLGAAVALRYTTQNPANVKRLVVVALPIQGGYISNRLLNGDAATMAQKTIGKLTNYPEVETEIRKTDANAISAVTRQLLEYNFAADLANCTRPMLLVFGNQDPLVQQPIAEQESLHDAGNQRYYVLLDSCQHFPMLEQTPTFNRLVLDFVHAEDSKTKDVAPKDYWKRRTR